MGHPTSSYFRKYETKSGRSDKDLRSHNFKVATIHGDIPSRERRRVMKQIQQMDYQFVVATDLACTWD